MCELCIFNYATIHLIFLIWEEVQSLAIQKGKSTRIRKFLGSHFRYHFLQKEKRYFVSLTVSDLDQGQYPSAPSPSSDVRPKKRCILPSFLLSSEVTEAEILWAIQTVLTHMSLHSCDGISKLFSRMLSDSMIAKSFTLGKMKCSYFFNFSIALYLKELIVAELNSSNFFVTCYDESLNRVFQEEQMGMVLRYFNNKSCLVETSYFNSTFLKQPNSHNLHDKLLESLSTHDLRKLLQVSMDGPNVNWDVLKPHSSYREQTE